MRAVLNDTLRWIIGIALVIIGVVLETRQRIRIRTYSATQTRLRRSLGIASDAPIQLYGAHVERAIEDKVNAWQGTVSFAETSGSTGRRKRILYPAERVRRARMLFIDAFARALVRMPFRRHSFYVFSSMHQDGSLTSLMLTEASAPSYIVTLQAPDRVQSHPALRALAHQYGDAALRLWVLALSNPGILYSTNPSTLSVFFDALETDWLSVSALVRAFVRNRDAFSSEVIALERRLISRGATARMQAIAESAQSPSLDAIAPAVHAYVCWTGGYVQPFLDRLGARLPPERYRLLPMYSMSTETPETTPVYRGDTVAFLPLAPGVLYEFLPDGFEDDWRQLIEPRKVDRGREYTMVVSDPFGLTRYQTEDVFGCVGHVSGLPDLRFMRRRSLSYSFTGEKLTAEQSALALEQLRAEFPLIAGSCFMTIVPSIASATGLPRYLLIAIGMPPHSLADAANRVDTLLSELNTEYAAKRQSGRLGPVEGLAASRTDFLSRMAAGHEASWEAQFKFLPLYRTLWEQPPAPAHQAAGAESIR